MKSELYGKSCFLKELSIILEIKEKKKKNYKSLKKNTYFTFHFYVDATPSQPQVLNEIS